MVLVAGAALLARSLAALSEVEMGFDSDRLLVVRTAVPIKGRDDAPRATAMYRDLLADLRALPGVETVGGVTSLPTAVRSNGRYTVEGVPAPANGRGPQAILNVVTPDYFKTLRVPLRSGRDFADGDRLDAPFVAIVNESLARTSFAGQDPIGRRIQCGLDSREFMTIVGVVGDVRTWGPNLQIQPEIYMPYEQHPGAGVVAQPRGADARRRPAGAGRHDPPEDRRAQPGRAAAGGDDGYHHRDRVRHTAIPDVPAGGVRRRSRCCWRSRASTA